MFVMNGKGKLIQRIILLLIVIFIGTILFLTYYHSLRSKSNNKDHTSYIDRSTPPFVKPPPSEYTYNETAAPKSISNEPPYIKGYPLSKDVVIHSVHYDDRSRGGHKTIVLFLVDVKLDIFNNKWIVRCGSEKQTTDKFKVHKDREDILMHMFFGPKPYPYEDLVVECYDLDFNYGDHGYLWYKLKADTSEEDLLVTSSEEPIVIPGPRVTPTTKHNISIMTCTKVHNKGVPYVAEFLRYQETIGIDHVYVTVLDNFIKDGGLQKLITSDPYIKDAIKRKYITVGIWREWYEAREIYTHATSLEQMDCYYRYRGTYDYVFVLDTDDFFNPLEAGVTNVKDYVMKWCHGPNIGSCSFRWITYYPQACGLTTSDKPPDGNITKYLKSHAHQLEGNRKSIHLTKALVDCSFHDAKCDGCLIKGYKFVEVPKESAYVAHIRNGQKPPHGC